jgi:hypothetical protein
MQREGRGLPINVVEAGEWLRKAADVGEPRAQATLGVAIFIGETPPKDTLEAYKWETLAVARATEDELKKFALNSHQRMTSLMTAPEIAEGEARARRWSETWAAREDLVREKALRAFCDRRDTCPIMVESAAPSKTLLDRLRDQPKFTAFAEVRGPNGQLDTRGVIDVEKIQWRGVDKALIRIGTWAGPLNAYAATFLVERSAGSGWSASIVRGSEMMS